MEARIDVRKLQLLNDRITQTIDALNDVRMSTRGLSHSPAQPQGMPMPQGMGMQPSMPAPQMQPLPQSMPMSMPMPHLQSMSMPMPSMSMPMQPMPHLQPMSMPMPSMSMPMPSMPMPSMPMSGSMACAQPQPAGSMPSAQPQQPAPAPVYTQLFAHVPFMGNGMGLQHTAPMMMPYMPWGMSGLYMPSAHDLERQMCEMRACDLQRQAHTFPFMSA